MNVGDWVEINTGFYKGSLAQITYHSGNLFSVVTTSGEQRTYHGEDCFRQKPTRPIKEYEELFL